MRVAAVLLVLAACGRIGIDPLASADAPSPDAAPDAALVPCANEGSPCDDGNICTTASTCMAGVCVGATLACTVAKSEPEFSDVQGEKGWYYGFWEVSTDVDGAYDVATDFQELVLFPNTMWRPPSWQDMPSPQYTWAYLQGWGGHPGSFPEVRVPIRRWVSDVRGRANAIVHHNKADSGGDGTRGTLVVDGVTVFSRDIAGDDSAGYTETIAIELDVGTTVDLLLHPIGTDAQDTTTMWMNIESR